MLDKRLLTQAGREKKSFFLAFGSGFLSGILALLQAFCLAKIFNGVFLKSQGLNDINPWLFLLLAALLARAAFAWAGETAARRAGARIKYHLRQELLERLFALGPVSTGGSGTGERINLIVEGIEQLEGYFVKYLPQLAMAALIPLGILVALFPSDWITGLILLLTAPLLPVFMILIGSWSEKMAKRQWEGLNRISGHLFDVLQGLTTLKLLGRSKKQIEVISRLNREWQSATLSVLKIAFLSALTLELLVTISTAMIAVGLGLRLIEGGIDFERAMFILLLAPEFYSPLRMLGTQFHAGQQGTAAAEGIFAVLNGPHPAAATRSGAALTGLAETDSSFAGTNPAVSAITPTEEQETGIAFRDVYFSYEGNRPALNGLSFTIKPGEKVALVGKSGSGKSTAINLLLGFIAPAQGTLTCNGTPITALNQEEWRSRLTLVPQHPHLFAASVADNIGLGKKNATAEEIRKAAAQAQADDFIQALPQGYATRIGQGGMGLSSGQIQRLALARAFLADQPMLILDEATAGLDGESEAIIEQVIARLLAGRTALIIAHRPATLRLAERILVLENGRIAREGEQP